MPRKSTPLRPVEQCRGDETAGAPIAELESLERFARTVPTLRRLLALPAISDRELLLRAEMRRTIATLAAKLDETARGERKTTRAAVYRTAAIIAAELAAAPAAGGAAPAARDH